MEIIKLRIDQINVGQRHRKEMGNMDAFTRNLKERGLLQPIVVKRLKNGTYQILAGERRFRGWRANGNSTITAVVIDADSRLDELLIENDENEQRKELTPSEKSALFAEIKELFGSHQGQRKSETSLRGNCPEVADGKRVREVAAELAGFSNDREARRVETIIANGTPAVVAALDAGTLSKGDLEQLVKEPARIQDAAVKDVKKGKTRTARESVKNRKKKEEEVEHGDAWEGEAALPKVEPMDTLGNPIPNTLRDTFAGNKDALSRCVKLLQEVRRTVKGLEKWNAYMRPGELETTLDEMIEDFKNGFPYAVCQECAGKGCKVCRNEGWLTNWRHAELSK